MIYHDPRALRSLRALGPHNSPGLWPIGVRDRRLRIHDPFLPLNPPPWGPPGHHDPPPKRESPLLISTLERFFCHLVALLFFIAFSTPFCIDVGSIFHPNLAPKIDQNPPKIDAKMHFMLHAIFWSIFDRFSLSTLTPRISKIEPPLQREHDFSKNYLSKLCTFLLPFGSQLASIFLPKMHQNPSKIDFKMYPFFRSVLASFLNRFWFHFGSQLGLHGP